MNPEAVKFSRMVLGVQAIVHAVWFAAVTILSPTLLRIEPSVSAGVLDVGTILAIAAALSATGAAALRLRGHRYTLRSLALGSRALEMDDLRALARLPTALTARFLVTTSAVTLLFLVPGIRPERLDDGRAVSLLILSTTILGAVAVPHFVAVRAATSRLFEAASIDVATSVLEEVDSRRSHRLAITGRMLYAIMLPALLIGVGAVLVTHAHMRSFLEESRKETAQAIAFAAFEPTRGAIRQTEGRAEALAVARAHGYDAVITDLTPSDAHNLRQPDGKIAVSVPLEDGGAVVQFATTLDPLVITSGVAAAVLFALLAAWLTVRLSRSLSRDIERVTDRVRLLGTETVLHGASRLGPPARFDAVQSLERAIEQLAERFRVFAKAQEEALEARETAQRVRGLLFASVSHDLKSPLNAILGFADLIDRAELSPSQRESLDMISTRGRELLALIETILDAARVEAGQLKLEATPNNISLILRDAVRKARELVGADPNTDPTDSVSLEADPRIPPTPADPAYVTRAIAVIIAHALRVRMGDPNASVVGVRATVPSGSGQLRIDISHHSRHISPKELAALFTRQASDRGRGLTLGLSLARSIFELHAGRLDVEGSADGAPVVRCYLPLVAPPQNALRRRLSSYPALG